VIYVRKKSITLILLVGSVLAAGCASTSGSTASPSPHGGVTMSDATPSYPVKSSGQVQQIPLSGLPTPSQALPVLTAGQTKGLCTLAWSQVALGNDGRRLVVVVTASSKTIKGVQVEESTDLVTVTIYGTAPPNGPSTAQSVHTTALVDLPNPLGERRINATAGGICS